VSPPRSCQPFPCSSKVNGWKVDLKAGRVAKDEPRRESGLGGFVVREARERCDRLLDVVA
jgi:hypothetical protein